MTAALDPKTDQSGLERSSLSPDEARVIDAINARLSPPVTLEYLRRSLGLPYAKVQRIAQGLNDAGVLTAEVAASLRLASAKAKGSREAAAIPPMAQARNDAGDPIAATSASTTETRVREDRAVSDADNTVASPSPALPDVAASTVDGRGSCDTTPVMISLDELRVEPSLQVRVGTRDARITEYAESMADGVTFPPVDVMRIDGALYLVDGFHRVAAAKQNGSIEILAIVRDGDRRAGLLRAIEANTSHGERLTQAERRNAAMALLRDPEWSQWADAAIARRCGVSKMSVGRFRAAVGRVEPRTDNSNIVTDADERTYKTSSGERRQMNVRNLRSQRRRTKPDAAVAAADEDAAADPEVAGLIVEWNAVSERVIATSADAIRRSVDAERTEKFVDLVQRVETLSRDVRPTADAQSDHHGSASGSAGNC